MAHDVFISYAHRDKTTADATCATLEGAGIRCWIAPRDIAPGRDWSESIIEAIEGTRIFILIFSDNANASPQIKREVERAVSKGITVIPVRIEDVVPSKALEYFLSTPHWLDAFSPPLAAHLQKLTETVKAILQVNPVASVPSAIGSLSTEPATPRSLPPSTLAESRPTPGHLIAAATLLSYGGTGLLFELVFISLNPWADLRPDAKFLSVGGPLVDVASVVVALGTLAAKRWARNIGVATCLAGILIAADIFSAIGWDYLIPDKSITTALAKFWNEAPFILSAGLFAVPLLAIPSIGIKIFHMRAERGVQFFEIGVGLAIMLLVALVAYFYSICLMDENDGLFAAADLLAASIFITYAACAYMYAVGCDSISPLEYAIPKSVIGFAALVFIIDLPALSLIFAMGASKNDFFSNGDGAIWPGVSTSIFVIFAMSIYVVVRFRKEKK